MPYPPLGLLYLAAHLREAGIPVEVFDTTFETLAALKHRIESNPPLVVGIYANLMTRGNALAIAQVASQQSLVVLGGPEPDPHAQEYLKNGADLVVAGEGELALEAICKVAQDAQQRGRSARDLVGASAEQSWTNIPGLRFLDQHGQLIKTGPAVQVKDLSQQPFPARDLIPLDRYLDTWKEHHGHSSVSLITARGCPFTCTWCSHAVFGRTHRRRSPSDVADEIEAILDTYSPDRLWYADDVFTIHRKWTLSYAEELKRRNLRIPFECISRPDCLDPTLVEALEEMGCQRLWLGAESGSQRILDTMQRKTKVEDVVEKTKLLQRHGIEVGMFLMFGFEGEELEDMKATADHLKKAAPDTFLTTVAYPIKGTVYYDQVGERIVGPEDWSARTDRMLGVAGRHSTRYYEHATRWLVNDVQASLEHQRGGSLMRQARCWAAARVGQLGMRLTQHEQEQPDGKRGSGRGWSRFESRERRRVLVHKGDRMSSGPATESKDLSAGGTAQ